MKLVFATGGTGGHIFPALAIAQEAKRRGYAPVFLGHRDGMEADLVPQAGFPFYGVAAGKWDRQKPDPRQFLNAWTGQGQAVQLLKQLKPALVIGFGGFASFPGVAAARWLGVPFMLHEANAYPGLVTRLFARSAKTIIISQEITATHLSTQHTILIGYPVREMRVEKAHAREELGLPSDAVVTLVMGGSQGSVFLNNAVPSAFQKLKTETVVLHSTGKRWEQDVKAQTQLSNNPAFSNYVARGFVDAVLAWSAADIAITRAGFGTLSEAAFHGVPTIMVPLSTSADNHQLHNANAVASAGAGWVVEENDVLATQTERLAEVWEKALVVHDRNNASRAATLRSPKGATSSFVSVIDGLLAPKLAKMLHQAGSSL
jgi:UDP-N-acetylglucosamine--N-acetylmuramyl-(pentapeptide) pyrophosphoryl-undecaprenol N-acetylglucosamine transferase